MTRRDVPVKKYAVRLSEDERRRSKRWCARGKVRRTSLRSAETEIGKWRAETGARNPRPKDGNARNCPPETGARQPNPREDKRFSQTRKNQPGDRTAWLTRQSAANQSARQIPCYQGKKQGISQNR